MEFTMDMYDAIDQSVSKLGGLASAIEAFGSEPTFFTEEASEMLAGVASAVHDDLLRVRDAMDEARRGDGR